MSKPVFTAFIALLLSGGGAVAAETCTLPQVADTAALTPVAGSNLMTVPVAINGKPKQFLLDIGTGPTEVSPSGGGRSGPAGSRQDDQHHPARRHRQHGQYGRPARPVVQGARL